MSQFSLSESNPNDIVGGAGCLCHPRGSDETRGPFFVFQATTTDDNLSPHAVVCAHCVCAAKEQLTDQTMVEWADENGLKETWGSDAPPILDIEPDTDEEIPVI